MPSVNPSSSEVVDPVCGMSILPSDAVGQVEPPRPDLLLLQPELPRPVPRDSPTLPDAGASRRLAPPHGGGQARVHVPDGSGGAADRAGRVPEVRDGARAGDRSAPLTKTEWTCPMHPEIVRDAPGSCPICGMALEPRGRHARGAEPRARRHDAAVPLVARRSPRRSWRSWSPSSCPASRCTALSRRGG